MCKFFVWTLVVGLVLVFPTSSPARWGGPMGCLEAFEKATTCQGGEVDGCMGPKSSIERQELMQGHQAVLGLVKCFDSTAKELIRTEGRHVPLWPLLSLSVYIDYRPGTVDRR